MAKKKAHGPPGAAQRSQRQLSVSKTRHAALESIARARRKKTGDEITWQDIANEAIDKYVS